MANGFSGGQCSCTAKKTHSNFGLTRGSPSQTLIQQIEAQKYQSFSDAAGAKFSVDLPDNR
jgi:hypothetical protein